MIALLALILLVAVAILGTATRSKNQNAKNGSGDLAVSEANSAITETNSVIVAPTEIVATPDCISIFDLACSTDGLQTLCSLITEACNTPGLETICNTISEFGGPSPFTVFAPSNSAFEMLSPALQNAIQDPNVLSDILLFHTVESKILASDLVCGAAVTMANMKVTTTQCKDDHLFQSGPGNVDALPKIVTTDVNACNGVVHVIDQVILPNASTPVDHSNGNPSSSWNDMNSNGNSDHNISDQHQFGDPEPVGKYPGDEHHDDDLCRDEVSVSKPCYTFGEPIEVSYKSCSPGASNWLGVFRQGSSDRYGRMRQRAAYWEMPCGGHNVPCSTPMHSGTMTMNTRIGRGRYQVHSIGGINRPFISNSSSQVFVIRNNCQGALPSHGAVPSHH